MDLNAVCKQDAWGNKRWSVNGRLHRVDGPAVIRADGDQEWWVNNQLHRTDGPAIIRGNDEAQYWFINDRDITDEVEQWMREREITWPFDELTQVEFLLSWT